VKRDYENDEAGTRCKEQAIMDLGQLYSKHDKATSLAAKLVKALVDLFLDMEAATGSEVLDLVYFISVSKYRILVFFI